MQERAACALLKQRFEAAGFKIEDNLPFDEDGVRFEIDGFDARHRVGYEYATEEAGDSWDVDESVITALDARRERGELYVLIVHETDAPDAESLGTAADAFLADLRARGVGPSKAPERDAGPAPVVSPRIEDTTQLPPAGAEPPRAEAKVARSTTTRSKGSKSKARPSPRSRSTKKKPARK